LVRLLCDSVLAPENLEDFSVDRRHLQPTSKAIYQRRSPAPLRRPSVEIKHHVL
jgi:hypothetical protein